MENLSEEKNRIEKIKTMTNIIICVGVFILVIGIYFIVKSNQIVEPPLSDSTWYEISSKKINNHSTGVYMLMTGIFVAVCGIIIRFFNRKQ